MTTITAARRLSPKVRRLLREHDLQARAVAGTGAGGRVTPHDVLGAAGVARTARGTVLASPLARRLLREAGVELAAAARANDQRRITRGDAERLIGELSGNTGAAPAPAAPPRDGTTTEVEADVGRLVATLAALDGGFLTHNGFALTLPVAVASAAAAVLVRRPDLAGAAAAPAEDGRSYPSVHIGFAPAGPGQSAPAVVPDVQDLTVAGLGRRMQDAIARGGVGEPVASDAPRPVLVVVTETVTPDGLAASGGMGRLTVSTPTMHQVVGTDDLGHEVARTRPHATLRLDHDERTSREAAAAFLDELATAVTTWSLPVGP